MTIDIKDLPALPKPEGVTHLHSFWSHSKTQPTFQFTGDQMRAYGLECIKALGDPETVTLRRMLKAVWTKLAFLVPNFKYQGFEQRTEMDLNVAFEVLSAEIRNAKKAYGTNEHQIGVDIVDALNRVCPDWDSYHLAKPGMNVEMRSRAASMAILTLRGKRSRALKGWNDVINALDVNVPDWRAVKPFTTSLNERAVLAIERLAKGGLPEGWKVDQQDDVFKTITVTAPNGYAAVTSAMARNPENVLRMLAEALTKKDTP